MIQVSIESRRVCYKLDIKFRLNIVRGSSATGKSSLLYVLHLQNTKINSPYPIVTNLEYGSLATLEALKDKSRHIIILDEDFPELNHKLLYKFMLETDHIWIIISRKPFKHWAYPLHAVYQLSETGNQITLSQMYSESLLPRRILKCYTEDGKSLYHFLRIYYSNIYSLEGKDKLDPENIDPDSLILLDELGAGSMFELLDTSQTKLARKRSCIYLMPSFEGLVLQTPWAQGICHYTLDPLLLPINIEEAYAEILYKSVLPCIGRHSSSNKSHVHPCISDRCTPAGSYCPHIGKICNYGDKDKKILPEDLLKILEPLQTLTTLYEEQTQMFK